MVSMICVLIALSVLVDSGEQPVKTPSPTSEVVAATPEIRALVDAYMNRYHIWQRINWNYANYRIYFDYLPGIYSNPSALCGGMDCYVQDNMWRSHLEDLFALLHATDADVLALERSRRLALRTF